MHDSPRERETGSKKSARKMQQLLLDLWQEFTMTVIFITHDIDEAIFLSDRLIVLTERPGGIKAEIATGLNGRVIPSC